MELQSNSAIVFAGTLARFATCASAILMVSCNQSSNAPHANSGAYVIGSKNNYHVTDRSGKALTSNIAFREYEDNCDWPIPVKGKTNEWGYIGRDGVFVIEPQYIWAACFAGDYANVYTKEGHKIIGKNNSIRLEFFGPQFHDIGTFAYGRAAYRIHSGGDAIAGGGVRYGLLDEQGKVFSRPVFDVATYYSDGLMLVSRHDWRKLGYINTSGDVAIPPIFTTGRPFHEGLARVSISEGGKFGFIDTTGSPVIPYDFVDGTDFFEGLAAVKIENAWGYIDKSGKVVIAPQFSEAGRFRDGLARVKVQGQYKYVDSRGVIVPALAFE